MSVLIASHAGMGQRRRGSAAGLERIPPAPNLVEGGEGLLRREWGSTSTTSCDAAWHWETAVPTREQDRDPAFLGSPRSPTPGREWSDSRPPMRPAGAG
jgi:hypothetical protein